LLVARIQLALLLWVGSRRSFDARIAHERELIRALLRKCNSDVEAQRVLIPRIRGLEDSSRYWSVWMTLDHLRIVHESLAHLIRELVREVTPPGAASTAAVKPYADEFGSDDIAGERFGGRLVAHAIREFQHEIIALD
jgi:hypothetical protein